MTDNRTASTTANTKVIRNGVLEANPGHLSSSAEVVSSEEKNKQTNKQTNNEQLVQLKHNNDEQTLTLIWTDSDLCSSCHVHAFCYCVLLMWDIMFTYIYLQ